MNEEQIIWLHRAAPAKPAPGAPCNGCGQCCAATTCPIGWMIFHQRTGPCPALEWHQTNSQYRCGLLQSPSHYLRWLPKFAQPWAKRIFARWIAAGRGCDSWYEEVS